MSNIQAELYWRINEKCKAHPCVTQFHYLLIHPHSDARGKKKRRIEEVIITEAVVQRGKVHGESSAAQPASLDGIFKISAVINPFTG